jgi:hypothetical protein
MTFIPALALAATIAQAVPPSAACSATPIIEFQMNSGAPERDWVRSASSVAFKMPKTVDAGRAVLLERAGGFRRSDFSMGLRQYRRVGRDTGGAVGARAWLQMLAGQSSGFNSQTPEPSMTKFMIQPGVGLAIGTPRHAIGVRVDYRFVKNGYILVKDQRHSMSDWNVMFGYTWGIHSKTLKDRSGAPCTAPALVSTSKPVSTSNPLFELAMGFNGPQFWTAEFPGVLLGGAWNALRREQWGLSLVVESDASYARPSTAAGVRAYGRIFNPTSRFGTTLFAQALIGSVNENRQGVIFGNGGSLKQFGAGLTFGTRRRAFLMQVDREDIPGGVIRDELKRNEPTPLSRTRGTVGFVLRFGG